ncbi:hypothetical protein DXD09_04765 [Ligilactobacillus ruminis]|uniref:Uncharacterized protein n=1 Tax=Ligilactobacillus ruminis TaxID=1623 RepID=A0A8B2Z052_9LACO|nr:hypothetical protein DXD09_04765 [Ligilactobacillus ruminis]
MSVNSHHNGQKFTDKSPENAGLSVKCVLLTDKSAKKGTLSVNLDEILSEMVEQIHFQKSSFFRPFFIIDKKRSCQNTTVRYFSSSSLKSPFRDGMRPSSC